MNPLNFKAKVLVIFRTASAHGRHTPAFGHPSQEGKFKSFSAIKAAAELILKNLPGGAAHKAGDQCWLYILATNFQPSLNLYKDKKSV